MEPWKTKSGNRKKNCWISPRIAGMTTDPVYVPNLVLEALVGVVFNPYVRYRWQGQVEAVVRDIVEPGLDTSSTGAGDSFLCIGNPEIISILFYTRGIVPINKKIPVRHALLAPSKQKSDFQTRRDRPRTEKLRKSQDKWLGIKDAAGCMEISIRKTIRCN